MDRNSQINIIIPLITAIVIWIVVIWWAVSVASIESGPVPPPSPDFDDLRRDFNSHPEDLWMTENLDRFGQELGDNDYHYSILDSSRTIIYTNRSNPDTEPDQILSESMEVISSMSLGEFSIVRNKTRNLAIRVTDERSEYRIVHISASGI